MADRLQLVGGPLDGHTIPRQSGAYAWVRGKRVAQRERVGGLLVKVVALEGGGAVPHPTDGLALYELLERRRGAVYVYAGHRLTYCNGCGCYHGRAEGGREKRPCALGGDHS